MSVLLFCHSSSPVDQYRSICVQDASGYVASCTRLNCRPQLSFLGFCYAPRKKTWETTCHRICQILMKWPAKKAARFRRWPAKDQMKHHSRIYMPRGDLISPGYISLHFEPTYVSLIHQIIDAQKRGRRMPHKKSLTYAKMAFLPCQIMIRRLFCLGIKAYSKEVFSIGHSTVFAVIPVVPPLALQRIRVFAFKPC